MNTNKKTRKQILLEDKIDDYLELLIPRCVRGLNYIGSMKAENHCRDDKRMILGALQDFKVCMEQGLEWCEKLKKFIKEASNGS